MLVNFILVFKKYYQPIFLIGYAVQRVVFQFALYRGIQT